MFSKGHAVTVPDVIKISTTVASILILVAGLAYTGGSIAYEHHKANTPWGKLRQLNEANLAACEAAGQSMCEFTMPEEW